ncbi:MAG: DUF5360 family protein [Halioglobus sp.]
MTATEGGMLLYWVVASLVVAGLLNVPPEYMYSDYQNPLIVAWNWSFFPLDVMFAVLGLVGRFANIDPYRKQFLSVVSLSLMFCAGLMAISFWIVNRDFDPFWWGINVWLLVLSTWALLEHYRYSR